MHRLGAQANLTLGNKKAVDIVVVREAGDALTIDVKGLAGKTNWPVDNFQERKNHYLIFVCFLDKIRDLDVSPEVYVVPAERVAALTYTAPCGQKVVQLSRMRKDGASFKSAWHLLG